MQFLKLYTTNMVVNLSQLFRNKFSQVYHALLTILVTMLPLEGYIRKVLVPVKRKFKLFITEGKINREMKYRLLKNCFFPNRLKTNKQF